MKIILVLVVAMFMWIGTHSVAYAQQQPTQTDAAALKKAQAEKARICGDILGKINGFLGRHDGKDIIRDNANYARINLWSLLHARYSCPKEELYQTYNSHTFMTRPGR